MGKNKRNNKNKKDIAKKTVALGAALGVVAGIGASLNGGQEAFARSRTDSTSQTTTTSTESTTTTKRPTTNVANTGSGRPRTATDKRKAQAKVISSSVSTDVENQDTENSENKRPTTNSYKTVEEKKSQAKATIEKIKASNSNSTAQKNKIVVKVSTNK